MSAFALQEKRGEVRSYFEALGYRVTWDFNVSQGKEWWEIHDDRWLIVQIEMVPLPAIVEDMLCFHHGVPATSNVDYELRGRVGKRMRRLYELVHERENSR